MRGDLAAAILHDPKILYLDEPTIGLDVVAKERIRTFLLDLNRREGVTVLLTTHDMADISRLCERMLIIDHGKLLYDGGVGAITERYGGERRLTVDLAEEVADPTVPGARLERREGGAPHLQLPPRGDDRPRPDRRPHRPLRHPRPHPGRARHRGGGAPDLRGRAAVRSRQSSVVGRQGVVSSQ